MPKKAALALVPAEEVRLVKNDKQLSKFYKDTLLANAPALLEEFFGQLMKGLKRGDPKMMDTAADVLKLRKQPGGTQVNIQNNQHNSMNGGSTRDRTSEAIIRRLESRDMGKRSTDDVEEAEFTEVVDQKTSV